VRVIILDALFSSTILHCWLVVGFFIWANVSWFTGQLASI
jgi:hypothetical protein